MSEGRICEVCGSSKFVNFNKTVGMLLCGRHYQQVYKHGRILERTQRTPNEIIEYKELGYAEMLLYDREQNEIARTKISLDKIELVSKYRWNVSSSHGYVASGSSNDGILLHRLVMNAKDNENIDHIHGDKLDNRNEMLRVVTQSQNGMNAKKKSNNTSGVTGVYFDSDRNDWVAEIHVNRKKIFLIRSKHKEEAVKARKEAEIKYFGEYRADKGVRKHEQSRKAI